MLDGIIDFINGALGSVLGFLPDSPFLAYMGILKNQEWLSTLNWLMPIGEMIAVGQVWLGAVGIYYIYQIILRWARAVE